MLFRIMLEFLHVAERGALSPVGALWMNALLA
jgi:hypothetical protein